MIIKSQAQRISRPVRVHNRKFAGNGQFVWNASWSFAGGPRLLCGLFVWRQVYELVLAR